MDRRDPANAPREELFAADPPPYRPLSARRRLLLVLLAIVTACAVGWLMLQPQLRAMQAKPASARGAASAAAGQPCAPGETSGCVGGTMVVTPVSPTTPVAGPASAPR